MNLTNLGVGNKAYFRKWKKNITGELIEDRMPGISPKLFIIIRVSWWLWQSFVCLTFVFVNSIPWFYLSSRSNWDYPKPQAIIFISQRLSWLSSTLQIIGLGVITWYNYVGLLEVSSFFIKDPKWGNSFFLSLDMCMTMWCIVEPIL